MKGSKPVEEKLKENTPQIDSFLTALSTAISSRTVDAYARDAILQVFTKNIGESNNFFANFTNVSTIFT